MNSEAKNRPLISVPFLIFAVVLLVGGYFGGPWILTQVFRMQEAMKASEGAVSRGVPEGKPVLAGFDSTPAGDNGQENQENGDAAEGRRGGDPEQFFASRDADENGKLEGDEIPERMRGRIANIDSDADGAISKEEFLDAMAQMRARRDQRPASEDAGGEDAGGENAGGENGTNSDAAAPETGNQPEGADAAAPTEGTAAEDQKTAEPDSGSGDN